MSEHWWLVATAIWIVYYFVRRLDGKVIVRQIGREIRPGKFIFYAGVYVPIMSAIMISKNICIQMQGRCNCCSRFVLLKRLATLRHNRFLAKIMPNNALQLDRRIKSTACCC